MEKSDGVPTASAIDSSQDFYIHPSDYPNQNPISAVFDERSYSRGRRSVVIALSIKNKLVFIGRSLSVSIDKFLRKA